MTTVHFREVVIRGMRRWKDAEGKKHQETKKFFQTVNPFNLNADGDPKSDCEILDELIAERRKWMAEKMAP